MNKTTAAEEVSAGDSQADIEAHPISPLKPTLSG
jgi:hypothetical protein